MKSIIFKDTGREVDFNASDLPMLIHYLPGAGGSLLSVVAVADMFLRGERILFFTAYPMAREEFSELIKGSGQEGDVFYLENESQIEEAGKFRAVIVKSGDTELCARAWKQLSDAKERILFVKNIESILSKELFDLIKDYKKMMLSGDLDKVLFAQEITQIPFATTIVFSASSILKKNGSLALEKYVGYMEGARSGKITLKV